MPDSPAPKPTRAPRPSRRPTPDAVRPRRAFPYAELHCKTNFSFLEGASHPDELVVRAAELGYRALAITDRNSLAGVVRAHVAAKEVGLKLLIGAEITPVDVLPVVLLATDRSAYGRLSRLITRGRRNAQKGEVPAHVRRRGRACRRTARPASWPVTAATEPIEPLAEPLSRSFRRSLLLAGRASSRTRRPFGA